jgi:hypothetical protein
MGYAERAARLPQADCASSRNRLLAGGSEKTVIRAGFGLYYDDLAQNGWATAFQACEPCEFSGSPRRRPAHRSQNTRRLTPSTSPAECSTLSTSTGWRAPTISMSRAITATARFPIPAATVFASDNRSSYNALMLHVQGNMRRFNLVANYTLSKAQTWGCVLGELFDYVDGVCTGAERTECWKLDAFGPGDYGPSGEDVRHRFVLAGTVHIPGGFELSTITQVESARPITITTPTTAGAFRFL